MDKELVEKIYFNLNKSNNKYIILVEPVGIIHQTEEMYKFSLQDCQSRKYRNKTFIHNYPGILKKNNYKIEKCELSKIPNQRSDFLLKIISKKI